jgi:hypothetical protein
MVAEVFNNQGLDCKPIIMLIEAAEELEKLRIKHLVSKL